MTHLPDFAVTCFSLLNCLSIGKHSLSNMTNHRHTDRPNLSANACLR